ncbi:UDP-N-acetylglucosamine-lysosomal-acetylglucosaminephosphotransferase [Pantoea sp. Al-1710]|uniref:UDP-N-acetylglucosamine-lysosomal-acetylglucosaminephosphotransferase n=1 Tax=Candidatus Pantoea communis TaxID=2608354 RepID=A0ABX0RN94_9GAMM|nr:Stealth CR1 domain-containing protein [Pantoea communis]NIG18553.1 UDP-N-acetylglucosamine-lysosomal-acetylglucosaminephosphotransferase [Pantoea communis]
MNKLKRKTRKFLKNPRLFFNDMKTFKIFKKKMGIPVEESINTHSISSRIKLNTKTTSANDKYLHERKKIGSILKETPFSTLREDHITPHNQEMNFYKTLDEAGINYHKISLPWKHITRIAIQDSYINNVISLIEKNSNFTKKPYIVKGTNRFDLVKIYFHDETFVYKSNIIQLDPWYMSPSGTLTRNKNNLLQFIPKAHINKSVHSFYPVRLNRNENDIDQLNDMVKIDSFLFDEYSEPIDLVYTWVNDTDPEWRAKKTIFSNEDALSDETRFIEYEQLRYSLRSAAYYAKFIRNIFIVTDNQIPYWLDTDNEKIKVINHTDIFPNDSALPVFNSVAIESWIHKIPGLSENFIYANDDYFFGSPVTKDHFIHSNGIAKLFLESIPNAYGEIFEDSESTTKISLFTAMSFYNKYNKWPSFWPLHVPMIKNINLLEKMEGEFSELIHKTGFSRFREAETISPLYLMSAYYSFEKGRSVQSSISYEYISTDDPILEEKLDNLQKKLKSGKCSVFCINDHRTVSAHQVEKVVRFMCTAYPIAAEWEIDFN